MILTEKFGTLKDNSNASIYTITNKNIILKLTDIGASIVSIILPDINGEMRDIALGFEDFKGYEYNEPFFGSIVGRNANRIENAFFELDGEKYYLDKNDGENNLHSGNDKIHNKVWNIKSIKEEKNEIEFYLLLEDGFQNLPGNFNINVKYSLTEENEIIIEYSGTSDKTTIANFTNHCYFNLNGHNNGDILKHKLKIYAKEYTPFKENINIPSGEIKSVLSTPFDFTNFKEIGQDINSDDLQLKIGDGYDHNFVLDKPENVFSKVAEVFSEKTKICMEVFTDLSGIQFYTANFLDKKLKGKYNSYYNKRDGFCLETQYFPNSINIKNFKAPILEKNKSYYTKTMYKFKILK